MDDAVKYEVILPFMVTMHIPDHSTHNRIVKCIRKHYARVMIGRDITVYIRNVFSLNASLLTTSATEPLMFVWHLQFIRGDNPRAVSGQIQKALEGFSHTEREGHLQTRWRFRPEALHAEHRHECITRIHMTLMHIGVKMLNSCVSDIHLVINKVGSKYAINAYY